MAATKYLLVWLTLDYTPTEPGALDGQPTVVSRAVYDDLRRRWPDARSGLPVTLRQLRTEPWALLRDEQWHARRRAEGRLEEP